MENSLFGRLVRYASYGRSVAMAGVLLIVMSSVSAAEPSSVDRGADAHSRETLKWGVSSTGPETDCLLADKLCGEAESSQMRLGPLRYGVAGTITPVDSADTVSRALSAAAAVLPTDSPLALVDTKTLIEKFADHDASLERVRTGAVPVPRIFLARLPADLSELRSAKTRKSAFIKAVLPLVLRANQDVMAKRRRVIALRQVRRLGFGLGRTDREFLYQMAQDYDVPADDIDALLRRVDIVPPSVALAQAAEESGWGTSRFARRGNAVFGQRTFKSGHGMVPLRREEGKRHEVRAFDRLETSVRAYLWNLNTHDAYAQFRTLRDRYRRNGMPLDSAALIGTLERYSERGKDYVETIRVIVRVNKLQQFDTARLATAEAQTTGFGEPARLRVAY